MGDGARDALAAVGVRASGDGAAERRSPRESIAAERRSPRESIAASVFGRRDRRRSRRAQEDRLDASRAVYGVRIRGFGDGGDDVVWFSELAGEERFARGDARRLRLDDARGDIAEVRTVRDVRTV